MFFSFLLSCLAQERPARHQELSSYQFVGVPCHQLLLTNPQQLRCHSLRQPICAERSSKRADIGHRKEPPLRFFSLPAVAVLLQSALQLSAVRREGSAHRLGLNVGAQLRRSFTANLQSKDG